MTDEPIYDPVYEPPERRPSRRQRSMLDSPVLSAALVVVVLGLVGAVILIQGLVSPGPNASGRPSVAPTVSGPSIAPTFVRPTPSPAPTFLSYTVRRGDTLNSIARQFGTTGRSIAWWNRGTYPSLDPVSGGYDPNTIRVGWVLLLMPDTVVDDANPPSLPPGASPGATPGASPVAGPATQLAHGPRSASNIALTFDMGGRLDPAVDIVEWLIEHEVHATLFPTGASGSQTAQGITALQLAATRPDLFDFANHSWDHPDFRDLTPAQMADQLVRTENALAPIFGSTKPWFRPPFGATSDAVRLGVGAAGWRSVVMWDVDTIDWRPEADGGPTAEQIVAKISTEAQGGSIVLMHLGGYNTLEALPGILSAVGALGLEPVTLDEMLGA
jgi:peptidoglycan/xylan/chitin deacetylase (PgdA/CDA1 family)